ncbi:MAG: Arc family DNA-binding protein [Clostridia bacterium]|nr:Arc family DNA-binding protein [Clostridia bacterium]
MATNKIQTGIRFEPELLRKISIIAKENKRSLNAQLEFLALQCVKTYEKENGEISIDPSDLFNQ